MTKLQSLSMRIAKLQAEFEHEKNTIKARQGYSAGADYVSYYVRETHVKAFYRRGHIVLRVRQ